MGLHFSGGSCTSYRLCPHRPRVDLHATLSRDQLHGLPWAEDLDFIGTDLLAIAAAAKYRKGGQDTLAPYKLGILQVPTELKDPKSFTTTLYVPKFPNHLVEKHIKCVTSPQIVFDGDSVNGLRFVTGGADRRIILWHLTGLTPGLPGKPGEAVVSPKLLLTSSASIDAMAWNGRSQRLFSASGDQVSSQSTL